MSEPVPPAAVPDAPPGHPADAGLPPWQRWLNQFCENWIFAFLVAMAIRLFLVEAYGIPTASMEPMLYGDPGFLKGDHVVVDKLAWRFAGIARWDVTVFQFPLPELESRRGRDARPAVDEMGQRLDRPFLRPPLCRNFVKRAVVLPGDTFYIAAGNLYLKQPDGSFACPRKPERVQAALWQEIWRCGEQAGYLPWRAEGGGAVAEADGALHLTLGASPIAFTQPLRNLYLKPGKVRVVARPESGDPGEIVDGAMTAPVFPYRGREGNLWDLDQWQLYRLTSADLDSKSHGTGLNDKMDEWVGDVRLVGTLASLAGSLDIALRQGAARAWILHLEPAGWRITADGVQVAAGSEAPAGRAIAFAHCDDRLTLALDGREVAVVAVPAGDPGRDRPRIELAGAGTAVLAGAAVQRDVHYSARGFLAEERDNARAYARALRDAGEDEDRDTMARHLALIRAVREQMRPGVALDPAAATAPWGFSPATAITAPADGYLLLGDNSPVSWDSRMWGWVPARNLRGQALAVILPPWRWRIVR